MKNKLKKYVEQNKMNIIIFIIILIITCIIFIPFLIGHYATDTYNIYNLGYKEFAITNSFKDGRIFTGIAVLIAHVTNVPIKISVSIMLFIALVISNIIVIIIKNIVEKYKPAKNIKQQIIITSMSYITVFNFMYLDNLYFWECGIMALSVLLYVLSANILVEKNSKYFLKSMILTILGVMCYQGTIGLFFTYVLLFSILKNKENIKSIVRDFAQCIIIAVISIAMELILIKIISNIINVKTNRFGDITKIFQNIIYILSSLGNGLYRTSNFLPNGLYILCLFILSAIFLVYLVTNKKEDILVYQYFTIIIITIASAYVINLTTLSSFDAGRLRVPIGTLIGIIFIFLYVRTDIFEKKGFFKNAIIIALMIYAIINTINYESMIIQHKIVNKLEKQEADQIEQYIKQYEDENNIKVTKISKIKLLGTNLYDMNKGYFDQVKNKSDYTKNAIRTLWGVKGAFEIYENRKFEEVRLSYEARNKFIENENPEKGYKCINDVLYIYMYNY